MSTEAYNLFPQRVVAHDCDFFYAYRQRLIDYAYYLRSHFDSQIYTVHKGWQSPQDVKEREDFRQFVPFFDWNIRQCFVHYGFDLQKVGYRLEICVFNIGAPGSYHFSHVHPKCDISSVLWIQSPENCGRLVFENPDGFSQTPIIEHLEQKKRDEIKTGSKYFFDPKEGCMLLFPPNLSHYVEENQSNDHRISVVFNFKFI